MLAFDTALNYWQKLSCDSSGNLNVNLSAGALSGLAQESTLLTMSSNLVKADTDNVTVISSVLPSNASTLSEQVSQTTHLATIAGKTIDTSNVTVTSSSLPSNASTLSEQVSQTIHLANIAGKTIDTSNVSVTSSVLASNASTLTEQQSQTTHLSTLAGTVSAGKVQVVQATPSNVGSRGNIESNASIASNAVSSLSPSVSGFGEHARLYVEDTLTGNANGYAVEVSINGTDYQLYDVLYMADNYNASKREASMAVNCRGLSNIRIRNLATVSASTVYASIVA